MTIKQSSWKAVNFFVWSIKRLFSNQRQVLEKNMSTKYLGGKEEPFKRHVEACCLGQPGRRLPFKNAAPELKQKYCFVFYKALFSTLPFREAETLRCFSINRTKHLKFPRGVHKSVHTFYVARFF